MPSILGDTAFGLAAQAWTYPETEHKTMDVALATAVARQIQILLEQLEHAWCVIANAGRGDWTLESKVWQQAAAQWRDDWEHVQDMELFRISPRLLPPVSELRKVAEVVVEERTRRIEL